MAHIASAGVEHDGKLMVWKWRTNTLLSSNSLSSRVTFVGSKADGTFMTSGLRHLKFWSLCRSQSTTKPHLEGRQAVLGVERNNMFVAATGGVDPSDTSNVYALSSRGLLCLFNRENTMERYVNVKPCQSASNGRALSLDVCVRCVAVGCSDGIVRLFAPGTLQYIATLPKPAPCKKQDARAIDQQLSLSYDPGDEVFPDAVCVSLSADGNRLTVIYSDRSMFVWDIRNSDNIGKYRSSLAHAGSIWDVEMVPTCGSHCTRELPPGTFATSSADSTIRFWNIDRKGKMEEVDAKPRNPYSREAVGILYCGTDTQLQAWKAPDPELSEQTAPCKHVPCADHVEIRCMRISPDGAYLASGDRTGNVRVHELADQQLYAFQEAHDSEVLALDFSPPLDGDAEQSVLLATASRDQLVHVFDSRTAFQLAHTSDDHAGSVTGLCFAHDVNSKKSTNFYSLVTCGTDQKIVFRDVNIAGVKVLSSLRQQAAHSSGSLHDVVMTHDGKFAVTVGNSHTIEIWDVNCGTLSRTIQIDGKARPLKLALDPSDSLMAVCCSDRGVRLYDFDTGELYYKVRGHSEVVTALKFSVNGSELVTVSVDCCIFIWRIGSDLRRMIRHRMAERAKAAAIADDAAPQNPPTAIAQTIKTSGDEVKLQHTPRETTDASADRNTEHQLHSPSSDQVKLQGDASKVDHTKDPIIDLSETMQPKWAKNISIEVQHRKVKSNTGPRCDSPTIISGDKCAEQSSCWAAVQTELFSASKSVDPLASSTQEKSSPHAVNQCCVEDNDVMLCDVSGDEAQDDDDDDDDDDVVYFKRSDIKTEAPNFEVTRSINTDPAPAHLASSSCVQIHADDQGTILAAKLSEADEECAIPSWLRHDAQNADDSTSWAVDANASLRQSFSARYRALQSTQRSSAESTKVRRTLQEERDALKRAETEIIQTAFSNTPIRGSNNHVVDSTDSKMSLLGSKKRLLPRSPKHTLRADKKGTTSEAAQLAKEKLVARHLKREAKNTRRKARANQQALNEKQRHTSDPRSKSELDSEQEPNLEPESEPKTEAEPEPKPEPQSKSVKKPVQMTEPEPESEPKTEAEPKPEPQSKSMKEQLQVTEPEPESEPKTEAEPEPKPEPGSETQNKSDPEPEPKPKNEMVNEQGQVTEPESEPKSEPESEPESEAKPGPDPETESATEIKPDASLAVEDEIEGMNETTVRAKSRIAAATEHKMEPEKKTKDNATSMEHDTDDQSKHQAKQRLKAATLKCDRIAQEPYDSNNTKLKRMSMWSAFLDSNKLVCGPRVQSTTYHATEMDLSCKDRKELLRDKVENVLENASTALASVLKIYSDITSSTPGGARLPLDHSSATEQADAVHMLQTFLDSVQNRIKEATATAYVRDSSIDSPDMPDADDACDAPRISEISNEVHSIRGDISSIDSKLQDLLNAIGQGQNTNIGSQKRR